MVSPTAQLGLSRRAATYFLLAGLSSIALMAIGGVFSIQSMLSAQATDAALSRVERLAAAIELDHVRTNGRRTQELVEDARTEARCVYAAIVDSHGRFRAHTNPARVGDQALQPVGKPLHWGAIEGVRFRDASGATVGEYAKRLDAGEETIGHLRVAIAEPQLTGVAAQLSQHTTAALIAPLACIALGCWLLVRVTQPIAEIEQRLTMIARGSTVEATILEPVIPNGLASVGWNRCSERLAELRAAESAADPELKLATNVDDDRLSRQALESLAEGVAITDTEGRVEFANAAIEALLGVNGELEGEAFLATLEGISPTGAESFQVAGRATVTVSEAPIGEEGSQKTLRVERSPLRNASGSAIDPTNGHVWTIRDVTQQKLVEATRDQFIDTATHELRTPLSNIKAYAETLASGDFQDIEQQKEFCNTINTEATRLARFVDDLLSISSLETGSLSITRQAVKVRRLVDEAAEKVRPLMKASSIKLEEKFSEKLGEASLDKDKVSGLLVNLLGNAAKYSPEGSTVTFTAVRKDDGLQFEVRDTGHGIAEEEQGRVFEKFFRSANPDVRDKVGTGLGLPLAREIARLHRGDITLESKLGEGSTFTVNLPLS